MSIKSSFFFTCSMTSGAIQHGVPTKVFLTLFRVTSPPVAKNALTPKSEREKKKSPLFYVRHHCLQILTLRTPLFLMGFTVVVTCPGHHGAPSVTHQGGPATRHPLHFREHRDGDGLASPPVPTLSKPSYSSHQKGIKSHN